MCALKRIAAINDLSCVGKCSLTVSLPVVSAAGVECSCMPTAVLSTHTAVFTDYTVRDLSDDMLPIARHWKKEGVHFDGIYSGYMISPGQGEIISEIFDMISNDDTLIIVDPVMADNGSYYAGMGEEMAEAFRKLCAKAHIITPNVTEACYLTGVEYQSAPHSEEYINKLLDGLKKLCSGRIILTGVCPDENRIGNVSWDGRSGEMSACFNDRLPAAYHGTGDVFTSCLAALLVRGAAVDKAVELSAKLVRDSMARSIDSGIPHHLGVDFEGILPQFTAEVEKLLG
ncbi:MAG: pyridoxamine kinase [Oscillospiraceae bacterium]|nr:pyridoxamine kinase [Oscillospiraceae bacterium]